MRWASCCLIVLLAIAAGGEVRAGGVNVTWTGTAGNNNWATSANWAPATSLTVDYVTQWNLVYGGTGGTSNNNISSVTSGTIRSFIFNAGAGAYTLTGSAVVIGNAAGFLNSSTSTQTISLAGITLVASNSFDATSGEFVINSPLLGANGFDVTGTRVTLTGSSSNTGASTVTTGALRITNSWALGGTSSGLTVAGGAALELAGGISVGAEPITSLQGTGISTGGALRNVSGTNTWGGLISLSNPTRINSDAGLLRLEVASGLAITGANRALTFGGAGDILVNDPISNTTATLTKDGAGILTLAASNTYSGATTISAGWIRATSSTFALGQGTLSLSGGNLELANDTGLIFGRNTTVATSGTIRSDRLTSGAGVTHTLGTLGIGAQTLTLDTDATTVTSGTAGLTFGAVTLSAGGAAFNPSAGTLLTLGGFTGNTFSFTVGGDGNTNITGAIATTSGALTKTGAGTLTLSASSTYTGTTTISGGTLRSGTGGAVGSGAVTIQNGATLDLGSFADSVGVVTLTSGRIIGTGTLTSNANFRTTSGTISTPLGGGNIGIVQGSGTTFLTAANLFTGTVSIGSGGALNLQNANALAASGSAVTVASGGGLQLEAANATFAGKPLTLGGSGPAGGGALLNVSGTNTWQGIVALSSSSRINADAGQLTLSGTIGGAFGLTFGGAGDVVVSNTIATGANGITKDGSGTLTLSAANSYSGTTSVLAGVLNVRNNGALGTTGGGVTVSSGAALELQNGIAVGAEALSIAGSGIASGGALRNVSGTNSYGGLITQTAATLINADAGQLTLSGGLAGGFGLTFGGPGNIVVSGTIATGANGIVKTGAGLLTLSASNTYTGATTVESGTLRLGFANAVPGASAITLGSAGSTASLELSTNSLSISSLTFTGLGGSVPAAAGLATFRNAVTGTALITVLSGTGNEYHPDTTLSSRTVIDVASDAALLFHATLSGTAPLTKGGAGMFDIYGNNEAYTGAIALTGGTTRLIGGNATLGSGTTTVFTGATLDFNNRPFVGTFVIDGGSVVNLTSGSSQVVINGDATISGASTSADFLVTSTGSVAFDVALSGTSAVTIDLGGKAVFNQNVAGLVDAHGASMFVGDLVNGANVQVGLVGQSGAVSTVAGDVGQAASVSVNGGASATFSGTVAGSIGASGTVAISGRVASTGGLAVNSGGVARLLDGSVYEAPGLTNNGTLVVNRATSLALATVISGSGSLQKAGSGVLELTGANTFTGPTSLVGGSLLVNGSLASGVVAAASTTLGGSGSIAGTLSGAGLVSPGNSPGILTAAAFDPFGGLDAAFEFTANAPNYAFSGSAALNDVMRLTGGDPFAGTALATGNEVDVYFNVASVSENEVFQGGFFTTQTPEQLLAAVENAQFQFWIKTNGAGQRTFGGVNYDPLNYQYSAFSGARVQTRQVTVNFGDGNVTGAVTEYVVIPEPTSVMLAGLGLLALVGRSRLRSLRLSCLTRLP